MLDEQSRAQQEAAHATGRRAVEAYTAIRNALPAPVHLLLASKQQSADSVLPLLEAGVTLFGENRVQEAYTKWPALKVRFPKAILHLIGPLQTNKAKEALALFDVIETLDRPSLAEKLASLLAASEGTVKKTECYVQVNTGKEPQKAGIAPEEASDFIAYCLHVLRLPVTGLMCIPPAAEPPESHFARLQALARTHQLPNLSMGMSQDYQTAIQYGATHIRLGRAVFGERALSLAAMKEWAEE